MGALDEPGLEAHVRQGCPCGSHRLDFQAYLDARVPLQGGEPVGAITWVYDGEKFVDGVYRITCADCGKILLDDARCPRCHAPGVLAAVLAAPNHWPVPKTCSGCDSDEVRYVAMVPARVRHEGSRAERPRTTSELWDPGFHGFRVDCADCGTVAERTDRCPLCDSPGPLRPRP